VHTGPMSESEGTFTGGTLTERTCSKCGKKTVRVQIWESSDGAYEDEKFTCTSCGHIYWVDGIDS
jgi:uncharacterized protein with PIN domain